MVSVSPCADIAKSSGSPIYFAKIADTQVPALQAWAQELTIPGRKDAILSHIRSTRDKFKWIKSSTEELLIRNGGECLKLIVVLADT